jgi:hypothetical protein
MQELELFVRECEALKKRNVEIISVRTMDAETTRSHENRADDVRFPISMAAGSKLELFWCSRDTMTLSARCFMAIFTMNA